MVCHPIADDEVVGFVSVLAPDLLRSKKSETCCSKAGIAVIFWACGRVWYCGEASLETG
jgi:hypothetical protein